MNLKPIVDDDEVPAPKNEFDTLGAFYHDLVDPYDGLSYYYMSFLLDKSIYIVKIDSEEMKVTECVKKKFIGDPDNQILDINLPSFMD
jgi:hypothetical protein